MKHIRLLPLLLLSFLLLPLSGQAQAFKKLNYQAVLRNAQGTPLSNQTVTVRFSILESGINQVYQEVQSTTTNAYGNIIAEIGGGNPVAFGAIDWSVGDYRLRVEVDNGSGFVNLGFTTLVAVPYALYADKAKTVDNLNLRLTDLSDVVAPTPTTGQVLKWDGNQWVPAADQGGTYAAGAGISIANNTITNTGDVNDADDITVNTPATGDLTGNYPGPTVTGIQGAPISSDPPTLNYVLKWNGFEWEPQPDNVTTGGGFNVTARLSGDGSIASPLDIAQQGATTGQVLKWTGTTWAPRNDSVGIQTLSIAGNQLSLSNGGGSVTLPGANYQPGPGVSIIGNIISNTGDINATDDITTSTAMGGDLQGFLPNAQIRSIRGNPISTLPPSPGNILKWNGNQWEYKPDSVADADADPNNEIQIISRTGSTINLNSATSSQSINLPYQAGRAITLTNQANDIIIASNAIVPGDTAGGDLTGSYPAPRVDGIQGFAVSAAPPSLNQVLKWNGVQWAPSPDLNTTYTAGSGISIIGNTIINTGDINAANDITTSTLAIGDVSGTFPSLNVTGLQNRPVANVSPNTGQVLRWNGTQWAPAFGDSLLYGAGPGIRITGSTITNTGDINGLDDITDVTNAAGDVTGTFSNLRVVRIQNNLISTSTPTNNQVLKFVGGQWTPAADNNTTYTAGTGLQLTGTVFSNTGDLNPNDDIKIGDAAAGDLAGSYPSPTVVRLQNNPISSTNPINGQVLKWSNGQWTPSFGDNTIYAPGTGINIVGNTIINTGDTDPGNDIINTSSAGGDLTGTFSTLNIARIQGRSIDAANPTAGQVLKWNGGANRWEPQPDANTTYTGGTAISVVGTVINNTGDTNPNDDITNTTSATGDLGGQYPAPIVTGIQTEPVASITPAAGQVLKYDGNQWVPSFGDNSIYSAGSGIAITGNVISNTGDLNPSDDITTATPGAGDVSGLFPNLTVTRIQSQAVSSAIPTANQVLKYIGGVWTPSADANTTYTAGTGLALTGTVFSNTGDINAADDVNIGSTAAGDLSGTYPNPTVARLQNQPVSTSAPTAVGQVLRWNGTQWAPSLGDNTIYNAGSGISITGNVIGNTGDTNASDDITTSTAAAGDLTGTYPAPTLARLQGNVVSAASPSANQVLKFVGGQWVPSTDENTTYTAGTGLALTGTVFSNTGDLNPSDDVTLGSTAAGDLSGTYPNPTVARIQGNAVSAAAPSANQVLKFVGGVWIPSEQDTIAYLAGTGISIAGATITNTGDVNPSDDVTIGSTAAGDLSGTYPNPTVARLQNQPVSTSAPTAVGQVLRWNGTQWAPSLGDNTIYTAGSGISITGNVIGNTGDTNASDDITTSTAAAGDLTGTYPAPTLARLQGNVVSAASPSANQVLKFVGGQWVPSTDENTTYTAGTGLALTGTVFSNTGDLNPSDDVTLGSAAAGDLSGTYPNPTVARIQGNAVSAVAPSANQVLKFVGGVWIPSEQDTIAYLAGTGISIAGATITNTGDVNPSDDVTIGSTAAGDLSGTYPNPTVARIQGNAVSAVAPSANQVLKFVGGVWIPSEQDTIAYLAGTGISITGATITNTGDTNAADDITTSTSAAGDLTGTYPAPTLARLQGNVVSAASPSANQVLKFVGGQWIASADENTTYTAGSGLALTGTVFSNTGDTNAADDITTSTNATGDVNGTFPSLTVDGIQGQPVANLIPTSGQVLKYVGGQWIPASDDNTTYSAGTGINITGTTISNTGDTNAADDITTSTAGAGDVAGNFPSLTVTAIRGTNIVATTPTTGQVLKFDGTNWVPSPDVGIVYTAGTGISISGTTIANTGDTNAADDITTSTSGAGDVTGTFPTLTVAGIRGQTVSPAVPAANQVLKYIGGVWTPSADDNTTYLGGTGISVVGNTIINTGDTNPADDVTTSSAAGGDATGTFTNLTVTGIQGEPVASLLPASGQVLKYNGTQWVPGSDENTTYTAGTGLSLTGTTFANTGDTNAADDITTSTAAAGDVTGTFPTLTVAAIQGTGVSATAPSNNQVLKYNGTEWIPGSDENTTYTAGTGLSLTGTTFANTGDTNAADDITTSTAAAGDVTGNFPTLTVAAIQGTGVSATAPATGQVLKYDGTNWVPASDDGIVYTAGTGIDITGNVVTNTGDTNAADDITTSTAAAGDVTGTFPTLTVAAIQGESISAATPTANQVLKYIGGVWTPSADDNTTYLGGTGISVVGNTIINTGDTDPADDVTTGSAAGGDASGTFGNLTVTGLQGEPVASLLPTSGQVLKYNGTQWVPASDENTTYTAGTGLSLTGTTFANTGDTNAADDITTSTAAAGDVTGTFPTLTVAAIQGESISAATPTANQVLKYIGGVWTPSADDNTTYLGGTGISVVGNTIINTGDTDPADDVTTGSAAGGDAFGTFGNLTVTGLQGEPVASLLPTSGQVLKYNGTQWVPASDENTTYTAGTGLSLTGTTFANTGDTNAADDITTGTAAAGDVTGTFPTLTVAALQGTGISATAPTTGQVLKYDGTNWVPASDDGIVYTAGTGIDITGNVVTNTGDTNASDDITTGTAAAGDVSGTFPTLTVAAIQGTSVSATAPTTGQVLKYDGTNWVPGSDDGIVYTAGTGIDISGNVVTNTGDTNAGDDITTSTSAAGDVTGTFPTLTVAAIQGTGVAATAPTTGQVLKYDGTEWVPGSDENTTYSAGAGLSLTGTTFANTGDTDASDDITTSSAAAGDVTGTFPTLTVAAIQGTGISAAAPTTGQVLRYDGTNWTPAEADTITYLAGTGISISGATISNNGDTNASDDITTATAAAGDVSGTFPTLTVAGIRGQVVSPSIPSANQVLKYIGGVWTPAADENTTYSAGTGLNLIGTTFLNTGDTDAADDVTTSSLAGGDATGVFSNLTVTGLQGNDVSNLAPGNGQALKFNGTQWAPAVDEVDDADSDPLNEIQALSIAGTTLSLSNGGGSVNIPTNTYVGGDGIAITGLTIINLGDRDSTNDITNTTAAAGDLSGTYPAPTVARIQGNPVAAGAPTTSQVLRWNGAAWAPAADSVNDDDSDPTNEFQNLSIVGNQLSLSDGNTITLPLVGASYAAGPGIDIDGSNIVSNTGDRDSTNDITNTTAAGGDLSGIYPNPTVAQIQGSPVAVAAPVTNDVLRWDGTAWTPSQDTDSDPLNEIQALSLSGITLSLSNGGGSVNLPYVGGTGIALSGPTIINLGDTDASDDITTATNATGDVTGLFPNLTVDGIQGNPVSNTIPSTGQVLQWSGTQWVPVFGNNSLYTAGTAISITGNVIANTGDTDPSDDITTATIANGDLSGNYPNPVVDGIQGNPVSNAVPSTGQVLQWNGTQWTPVFGNNSLYTAGTAISITGNVIANTGDTDPADDITTATLANGDLDGNYPNPVVDGIQGNPVSNAAPTTGQALLWNGTQWQPSLGNNTFYTTGAGISITGNVIANTGDTNAADDITTATAATGDVSGFFPALTVTALQGNPVSNTGPANGQFLKWNGTTWVPSESDTVAYLAGAGISITGATIANTGDTNASDDITNATAAAGDVSGTFPTLTVTALQGTGVAATAPNAGELLRYNGTNWTPSESDTITYLAGTGISITGATIANTGDTDGSDDITNATAAAGDVSGTFPTLTVTALQGTGVAATVPNAGELLRYNGTNWTPSESDTITYLAGAGISITGATIANTGDTDGSDDITNATAAAGDVSGTFPTLTVTALQGTGVAATAPNAGELLRYNGTNWTPSESDTITYLAGAGISITGATIANTGDADGSDDITNATAAAGDVSGTFPTLTVTALQGTGIAATVPNAGELLRYNGTNWTPSESDTITYLAGAGISITGATIANTGDTDGSDDITNATAAAGDVSGTFPTLTVTALQGTGVAATVPNAGELLRYNGTNWTPSESDTITYLAGAGISITGATIANTGDTDGSDDITNATAAAGDVSGTFPTLTVTALQGTGVAATVPNAGELLRYDGTNWTPEALTSSDLTVDASWIPNTDNTFALGSAGNRWTEVFAANGVINTSDARAKTNIQDLGYGLREIMMLHPVSYNWKTDPAGQQKIGLLAQEVAPILSEVVKTHTQVTDPATGKVDSVELSMYGINYSDIIPVLVKGIQEQQAVVETQKTQLESQQTVIEQQKAQLQALDQRMKQLEEMLNRLANEQKN
jgi:hypothetical protein